MNEERFKALLQAPVPSEAVQVTIKDQTFWCYQPEEANFLYNSIFNHTEYDMYGLSLKAGDLVFDLGANMGMFARYAQNKGCVVYAFEPIQRMFDVLQKNMAMADKVGCM